MNYIAKIQLYFCRLLVEPVCKYLLGVHILEAAIAETGCIGEEMGRVDQLSPQN